MRLSALPDIARFIFLGAGFLFEIESRPAPALVLAPAGYLFPVPENSAAKYFEKRLSPRKTIVPKIVPCLPIPLAFAPRLV